MRITIQAKIERADGTRKTVEVLSLRKTADKVPASGLGLMLGEVRDLSAKLQRIFLEEQVAELVAAMSRCPQCAVALPVKDAKSIVYRTAFGKAKLASPRLYSSCSSCGHKSHARNFQSSGRGGTAGENQSSMGLASDALRQRDVVRARAQVSRS